jgi:murein DD-endopeptidase MepM/ murein hydrolase activator NlpD
MRILRTVCGFFIFLIVQFFITDYSEAFKTNIVPDKVKPGDAFTIKISEANTLKPPIAEFYGRKIPFSSCGDGCFLALAAVSLKTKPDDYIVKLHIGEQKLSVELAVEHASFPETHLTLPAEKVFLGPKNLKRANIEAEKLKALWPKMTEKLWNGSFIFPLDNEVSTVFGVKRIINKKKNSRHTGMDIRGKEGEAVKASNSGRIVLAEELFFGGNTLILDHGLGIYSIYMHLSKLVVKPGDFVSKGDVIGLVGATGRATGPHLHFGIKVHSINANPLSLIRLKL